MMARDAYNLKIERDNKLADNDENVYPKNRKQNRNRNKKT